MKDRPGNRNKATQAVPRNTPPGETAGASTTADRPAAPSGRVWGDAGGTPLPCRSGQCPGGCPACAGGKCPLEGRTVALIGGLDRMEPAYKDLIGRLGGQCVCHTGKVRSGCRRLRQMVSKADMVVFMTTINSHAALSTVKDECKRCNKPMCALRQTGQSSLERVLRDMAA